MGTGKRGWRERFGEASMATHGRRIVSCLALLALGVGGTVWLLTDPSGATAGPHGLGPVLSPVLVLLALLFLVREIRSGDSRGPLMRRPPGSRSPSSSSASRTAGPHK
jgi:hypothetical protein